MAYARTQRSWFVPLLLLLVAYAWLMLWLWELSPYGAYLHHGQWTELGAAQGMCLYRGGGENSPLIHGLLYVGGWVLMTFAMMLPTTLPLLESYRRLTLRRRDRRLLITLVIVGYLTAWLLFGFVAHGFDWLLRALTADSVWLVFNGWAVGAAVFLGAGLFQFSALKYRCLEKCRLPLGFVTRHWTGRNERRHAVLLGLEHGVYCVGCCWALMLLMFVLGTGSVGWMLLLGAVMAAEKNLPFGRRLAAPLGGGLIVGAVAIVAYHLLPQGNYF